MQEFTTEKRTKGTTAGVTETDSFITGLVTLFILWDGLIPLALICFIVK